MPELIRDFAALAGLTLALWGLAKLAPWLALISAGLLLLCLAWILTGD